MAKVGLDLDTATITTLGPLIRRKEVSPVEVVEASLQRIQRLQPKLLPFITITAEHAMMRAKQLEGEVLHGRYRGLFHGIPYTLKDVIATRGIKTTWGDPKEVDYKPQESAAIHTLLDDAGGILLGKVVSEIGRASQGVVGCRNAWDPTRSPGTSSSGGGSATAASMGLGSIGTDTGGSVRHPGSNSGLVAFLPTYGRISIFGVHGSAVTTDQAGPITKTVEDNAIMMDILGVYDPRASNSLLEPRYDHRAFLREGIKGVRIGVPVDDWVWKDTLSEEEEEVCRKAVTVLEELGAYVSEVKLPRGGDCRSNLMSTTGPAALYYLDHFTEEQLARWPEAARGDPQGAIREPVEKHLRLLEQRALIKQEANEALATVDLIAMPTGSTYGDAWNEKEVTIRGRKWPARSRATYRNGLASICGHPAASVPCGFGNNGRWPIGIMLHGKPLSEPLLYRVAWAYEQATEWHKRHPDLAALAKAPNATR
jgi:Asp-tRNA(Asn)/Glu-tRNA(Gln) amidotransferase A subunit family amidase